MSGKPPVLTPEQVRRRRLIYVIAVSVAIDLIAVMVLVFLWMKGCIW